MFGKNAPHDIFVYLDAEGEYYAVCDARATTAGIALLQVDDGSDELLL